MTLTRSKLLVIAAAICAGVAVLIALPALDGNFAAWLAGSLFAFVLSFLP